MLRHGIAGSSQKASHARCICTFARLTTASHFGSFAMMRLLSAASSSIASSRARPKSIANRRRGQGPHVTTLPAQTTEREGRDGPGICELSDRRARRRGKEAPGEGPGTSTQRFWNPLVRYKGHPNWRGHQEWAGCCATSRGGGRYLVAVSRSESHDAALPSILRRLLRSPSVGRSASA